MNNETMTFAGFLMIDNKQPTFYCDDCASVFTESQLEMFTRIYGINLAPFSQDCHCCGKVVYVGKYNNPRYKKAEPKPSVTKARQWKGRQVRWARKAASNIEKAMMLLARAQMLQVYDGAGWATPSHRALLVKGSEELERNLREMVRRLEHIAGGVERHIANLTEATLDDKWVDPMEAVRKVAVQIQAGVEMQRRESDGEMIPVSKDSRVKVKKVKA